MIQSSSPGENTKKATIPRPTDVFRDPIHGLIKVYPWEKALIETPEFQRLRRIHQLSMTNLVYHGAEHSRFGHSEYSGAFSITSPAIGNHYSG